MRRHLIALAVTGLALVSFGCSSSDEGSPTSTTAPTTSSVVVSAANKPTCDAIAGYKNAADVPLAVEEDGDPVQNAMKIQAFIATLIAPLQTVESIAPAELKPSITTLIEGGQATVALDPADAADQAAISKALLAPESDVATARETLITWSAQNCGIAIK